MHSEYKKLRFSVYKTVALLCACDECFLVQIKHSISIAFICARVRFQCQHFRPRLPNCTPRWPSTHAEKGPFKCTVKCPAKRGSRAFFSSDFGYEEIFLIEGPLATVTRSFFLTKHRKSGIILDLKYRGTFFLDKKT